MEDVKGEAISCSEVKSVARAAKAWRRQSLLSGARKAYRNSAGELGCRGNLKMRGLD